MRVTYGYGEGMSKDVLFKNVNHFIIDRNIVKQKDKIIDLRFQYHEDKTLEITMMSESEFMHLEIFIIGLPKEYADFIINNLSLTPNEDNNEEISEYVENYLKDINFRLLKKDLCLGIFHNPRKDNVEYYIINKKNVPQETYNNLTDLVNRAEQIWKE